MATEIELFKSGIPAHLKTRPRNDITKSLLGSGGSSSKRISLRGSVFRMVVNGEELVASDERAMKVVIVNIAPKVSRSFYSDDYDSTVKAAPVCWSALGDRPDPLSSDPQHSACVGCPKNIKGSGSKNTVACKFQRKIAVVLENDLEGDVFELQLPSKSIFPKAEDGKLSLNAYASFLDGFGVNITDVVTEMRFDKDSSTPKLIFKGVRPLSVEEIETCSAKGQSPAAIAAITTSYSASKGAVAVAAPAKLVDLTEDEAPVEPKRRESKKDEQPPVKKELADVLAAWDDEE